MRALKDSLAATAAANAATAAANARADASDARSEAALKDIEAALKETFFTRMLAISSSSAPDTPSKTDERRRGAPTPPSLEVPDELLAEFFAEADDAAVAAAWAAFCARHAAVWRAPPAGPRLKENRDVHPSIAAVLDAVVPAGLRVWRDKSAPDDVASAHVRPDFTLTGVRDAAPSTIGALLFAEVKLPGALDAAAFQVRAYLRRRVYKLCCEADARGEALDRIFAFGVATDGADVVIARGASGAPALGDSFAGAIPCPVRETARLPLLGDWNFRAQPRFNAAGEAPSGFRALWRICAAPQRLGDGGALESLRIALRWAGGVEEERELHLGERLGSGGTSDVYECDSADTEGCVLKVARVATAGVAAEFDAERDALLSMPEAAAAGLVPHLVASGERLRDESHARVGAAAGAVPWPALLLRPRGVPLAAWLALRVESAAAEAGAGDAAGAAASARLACADTALLRMLAALQEASSAGLVHCDVRPANVVVVAGEVMLVDWGCVVAAGTRVQQCGVAAFVDARVFTKSGLRARTHLDVLAALYTWLTIVYGDGSIAPWETSSRQELSELFAARSSWMEARAVGGGDGARGERGARVAQAARLLERMDARSHDTALGDAHACVEATH